MVVLPVPRAPMMQLRPAENSMSSPSQKPPSTVMRRILWDARELSAGVSGIPLEGNVGRVAERYPTVPLAFERLPESEMRARADAHYALHERRRSVRHF